jgi:hypothetical protein
MGGIYGALFAGFVFGFICGQQVQYTWMKAKILRHHPHPDSLDVAMADINKEKKEDEEEEEKKTVWQRWFE